MKKLFEEPEVNVMNLTFETVTTGEDPNEVSGIVPDCEWD